MASTYEVNIEDDEPLSRTHQYRKVMKPLLERKRRARINGCLDELKDLMVFALQTEGESISKLEKADVLELTVRHLRKLKRQQMLALNPGLDLDRFHAGYTACATEVNRCLSNVPDVDVSVNGRLMSHLGHRLAVYQGRTPAVVDVHPHPPSSLSAEVDQGYMSGRESTPSPTQGIKKEPDSVWRPF